MEIAEIAGENFMESLPVSCANGREGKKRRKRGAWGPLSVKHGKRKGDFSTSFEL
jgi:hypothetical protein